MTLAPAEIWRRGGEQCPRCAHPFPIALRPADSRAERLYCVLCPHCLHSWALERPVRED